MLARRIKDAVIPATTGLMSAHPTGTTASPTLTTATSGEGGAGTDGGAYVEIVAASGITSEFRITSVVVSGFESATRYTITVATGVTSSEVVIGTFCVTAGATTDTYVVPVSMANIPANTRVSMRSAVLTGNDQTCTVAINYVTV
tara:strand:+ start:934 stop:1368 length:435 start_codon:yes stop_codon:yes gene_type:complete